MKIKNIALTLSILSFAIGFSDLQENIIFWMGRPIGALALIVYFVFMVLEKETATLDEQERSKTQQPTSAKPVFTNLKKQADKSILALAPSP